MALQPIVQLSTGQVLAHEALVRGPQGSDWEYPVTLFDRAQRLGLGAMLETTCRRLALTAGLHRLPQSQQLFLNVNLQYNGMPLDPARRALPVDRITIEVPESQPIMGDARLLEQLVAWRQAGFKIALDDYGAGYAGLGAVLAIQPDYLKLDRVLIAQIDHDPSRQRMVQAIRDWTRDLSILFIAEGIETPEELTALQRLGIDYGQGFLLGRPQWDPVTEPIPIIHAHLPNPVLTLPLPADPTVPSPGLDAFHRVAAHSAEHGVYFVNRRREILYWNPAAEALTGYRADEIVGHRCLVNLLNDTKLEGKLLCAFQTCPTLHTILDGHPRTAMVFVQHKDGHRIPITLTTTPVRGDRGEILGAVEHFHPVSEDVGIPTTTPSTPIRQYSHGNLQ
jgi:PAS domain S-box-containing protein